MTDPDPDDIDHLDFPTELPIDINLLPGRVAELIAGAPEDVLDRIRPHWRPGNTFVDFLGNDLVRVRMGPEPIGTIHYAALIPPDDDEAA